MRILSLFLLFLCYSSAFGQRLDSCSLTFGISLNGLPVRAGETAFVDAIQDSILIEKLQYYIGRVGFNHLEVSGGEVDGSAHYLLDLEEQNSLTMQVACPTEIESIQFELGVDSLTSVSGAMGGALDPTRGMYWTWQSGYINFKLEGSSPYCTSRNNAFQYHLGGYQFPYNNARKVDLEIAAPSQRKQFVIELALDKLLHQAFAEKEFDVMSPSENAMALADLLSKSFKIEP